MTVQTDFLERCKALNLHGGKLSDWLDEIESLRQQLAAAYEAGKRDASEDLEQAAFEKWLHDKCPSGDVESVQRQWLKSYEYAEFAGKLEQAAAGILIESLRQQLAAAQDEINEQARIVGMGGQREISLRQKLDMVSSLLREASGRMSYGHWSSEFRARVETALKTKGPKP